MFLQVEDTKEFVRHRFARALIAAKASAFSVNHASPAGLLAKDRLPAAARELSAAYQT
jgi:hypothetical protein